VRGICKERRRTDTCREECTPDPCGAPALAAEPEIVELHDEVERLRASFHRLDLHIKFEEPHREGKERRKEEKEDRRKDEKEERKKK
jgi:hypothetical protein